MERARQHPWITCSWTPIHVSWVLDQNPVTSRTFWSNCRRIYLVGGMNDFLINTPSLSFQIHMLLIAQLLSCIEKEWRLFALPALSLSLTASSILPWTFAFLHVIFCYPKQEKREKKNPHPRWKLASGSLITHSLQHMQGGVIKAIKYSELISAFGRYTHNITNDGCCCVPGRGILPPKGGSL